MYKRQVQSWIFLVKLAFITDQSIKTFLVINDLPQPTQKYNLPIVVVVNLFQIHVQLTKNNEISVMIKSIGKENVYY